MSNPSRTVAMFALVAAVFVSGCGNDIAQQRTIKLADCRLPNLPTAAQCGVLDVPEDRSKPAGRKIGIFAAVLPANTVNPKGDPFVILAGGPGQAASNLAPFAARLTELRRTRDVVLIDQRGTGRSSPLTCAAFKPRDDDVFDTDPLPRARDCLSELKSQGVDASQYTTEAWIADLEAMREALGYARWNLWGGSYGTRVAQEYLRRFPDRVRTMTLDGVAPAGMVIALDVWRTREAALAAVFKACEARPECRKAHPDVASTLAQIGKTLGDAGREVDIVDPRTGQLRREHVTLDVVLGALQPLTYAPETATLLPEMLTLASHGEFGPLLAANPALSTNIADQINTALHFSVACADDAPRITPAMEERALAGLLTQRLARQLIAVCAIWPRGATASDSTEPVRSDKPVLLISGGKDPVTPPAYGAEVAKGFTNSKHIVAPGYGHIVSPQACGPRLVAAFVDNAGFAKLPETCVTHFERSVPPVPWPNRLAP